MSVCVCECMCVYVYVCMCPNIIECACDLCSRVLRECRHYLRNTYVCLCVCACMCTTCWSECLYTCACVNKDMCTHTHIYIYIYIPGGSLVLFEYAGGAEGLTEHN
eukprot:GHVR01117239.1.p1 GENE.GHVR01117239.1~~GHVR01117239.1.p1  ORF type:complete len:106 (+),score=32.45 GHVR01117239.1:39-356(+)